MFMIRGRSIIPSSSDTKIVFELGGKFINYQI